MTCGVGHRNGSDHMLLWLWCRPAAAALIQPLAQELLYAKGATLKKKKKENPLSKSDKEQTLETITEMPRSRPPYTGEKFTTTTRDE